MEITLTQLELDAFTEMGITDIETYLKSIVNSYINQKLDEQLLNKSLEEKQSILSE